MMGRMDEKDIIDLRSDTVTRPGAAMREAMARALVGDDVYGEDPTVNELEKRAAHLTGKNAAMFVPSGTQANLIAQLVHVTPGEEVIAGEHSHCMRYEAGGGAAIAGAQYCVVPGNGLFTANDVKKRLSARTLHNPGTCLVWMENTHNMGGGIVFDTDEMARIWQVCSENDIRVHVDGARIFNASAATGVPVSEYASCADSMSFCLSKGLGAPVGSLLCGSGEFIDAARRMRKRLGGAMRQAGILAAAGLFALEHNVERLEQDHDNARLLAEGLKATRGIEVDLESVKTNIVMARPTRMTAPVLSARCKQRGVLFHPLTETRLRLVTHLDVTREMCVQALERMREALGS